MDIRAKENAPPMIEDARKVEGMTNRQINQVLELIIKTVLLIIPDIPERVKLVDILEEIKKTE